MRRNSSLALMLIAATALSWACNQGGGQRANTVAPETASATPTDGVRRISIAELKTAIEKNEAVVVDVRGEVEYQLGHIRGARSIPLGLINARANELPRDKLIVTYCA
jgi:predicted sulfurtransferase